jgi:hypothetical protein
MDHTNKKIERWNLDGIQRFKNALKHDFSSEERTKRDCDCWLNVGRCYCEQ